MKRNTDPRRLTATTCFRANENHTAALALGECWYAVHTKPHREAQAEAQLTAQHFRVFLPRLRKTVRHVRKLRTVSAPFFPGYLFVALDPRRDRWRSVNGTFGVISLVMGPELPRPMAHGVVESMCATAGPDGVLHLEHLLTVGQAVRVLVGPFTSLIGEIARIDEAGRVQVLLRLLGGSVPTLLGRDMLVPVQAA